MLLKLFNKLDRPLAVYALLIAMLFCLMLQYTGKCWQWCFTGKVRRGES